MKLLPVYLVALMISLAIPLQAADEAKMVQFGANSTPSGYVVQLNHRGNQCYMKITAVAPIVNRLRIVNAANHSVMYDDRPTVGKVVYIPAASYLVTGWSGYGTEDTHAVTTSFAVTHDSAAPSSASSSSSSTASSSSSPQSSQSSSQSSPQSSQSSAPQPSSSSSQGAASQPITVDGNPLQAGSSGSTLTVFSTGSSYGYPYIPLGYPYGAVVMPQSPFLWCTACNKYHGQNGCVFTQYVPSILDPYNPYWRPPYVIIKK
ncbi:MAG: hypothetical protein RDV48_08845 [Candidatus Eremiobacteraeota bacterium]|nr:hypothetical protein [Candidatus Eremiobacteraeota bacterium]